MFSIRLVTLDHYISKPIDEFYENLENSTNFWQEPVLRIFGCTPDGVKSCVHVHGVYPYIYIPYKGGENPDRDALLVGAALDEALKASLNTKLLRFVYKVSVISGIPLYGYHSKHRQFFKIYFYNPYHIKKASELLLSGAISGQKFQPHEAHIPYALQFMMDYKIYGMSFVTFAKVKYRRNSEDPESLTGVRKEDIFSHRVNKITCSRLEVDALASDITNRIDDQTVGVNPGLRAIWEDEKARRRKENLDSQITFLESRSRVDVGPVCPVEVIYKTRLAQKLARLSFQKPETEGVWEEPFSHSYPAEVPEDRDLLEASAIDDHIHSSHVREQVGDVSSLIDERILTQIAENEKEKTENESEGDEMEADSVLGRNQKTAEEAELDEEDEEGIDMTQPLDVDEEIIRGMERNRYERECSEIDDKTFWKIMASAIYQLDGAQESSSESEGEATPGSVSSGPLETSSVWSSNIMSILNEENGCSSSSAVCQTPRTFWSNYSSNGSSQNQDPWTWNKTCLPSSDFTERNQSENLVLDDLSESQREIASGEPYNHLFASNNGQYFSGSALTPLFSGDSTVSPPSAILTPSSEADGSDINLDSICESFEQPAPKEERILPDSKFIESNMSFNKKPENDRQKFLQVLKNFSSSKVPVEDYQNQLTLKQYIKDCKEIVSVDFKNLCNQEMIIIEYKSRSKKSVQNKYLIKPLDKFLESWNSAEKKASNRASFKDSETPKIINGFNVEEGKNLRSVINVLEKRFTDSSTVQSVSNKLTVKSMEILPESGGEVGKNRRYNLNQNLISQGKIKMKVINSQRKNSEETLGRRRTENRVGLRVKRKKRKDIEKTKQKPAIRRENQKLKKQGKRKNFSEPDTNLINEINSSFEEYFKRIVHRSNFIRKKKNFIKTSNDGDDDDDDDDDDGNYLEEEKDEEEEEEEYEYEQEKELSEDEKLSSRDSSGTDPIEFVTRFLSTFSRMSDMPPLSITINLGNLQSPVPVHFNFQPSAPRLEVEIRKPRRKMKLENVDGPADGSSSEDSANDETVRPKVQKRVRREPYYKPLNVVVCGSSEKFGGRKKRKIPKMQEEAEENKRKNFSARTVEGKKKQKFRSASERQKEKTSPQRLVKNEKNSPNLGDSRDDHSNHELDFIDDSDEEREYKRLGQKRQSLKSKVRTVIKNIPQADTEAFTSCDEEELNLTCMKLSEKGPPTLSETVEMSDRLCENPLSKPEENNEEAGNEFYVWESFSPVFSIPERLLADESISPVPGTSHDDCLEHTPICSPFTLSATPFFASIPSSAGFDSSSSSPLNSLTRSESVLLTGRIYGSSSSSEKYNFHSQVGFFGSSKSDDLSNEGAVFTKILDEVVGNKTIKPKQNPPSRADVVESMEVHGILESEDKAPFYGDPRDGSTAVEVGPRVLKIENRSLKKLKSFNSHLDIMSSEERRNLFVGPKKTERSGLVANGSVRIIPLLTPPSRKTVLEWLFLKKESEKREKKTEKMKVKILQPLSPEQDLESAEEMELSMTMTSLSGEPGPSGSTSREQSSKKLSQLLQLNTEESDLKKGPLSKIKGIKKVSLRKKFEAILEESEAQNRPLPDTDAIFPRETNENLDNSFQIKGVSLSNSFGFSRSVENMQEGKISHTHQHMTTLVLEVHVKTRQDLLPDPDHDPIRALFYAVTFDSLDKNQVTGVVAVGKGILSGTAVSGLVVHYVSTEKALVGKLLSFVKEWDPDILAGYEIEMNSWGYLIQRGFVLEMNLVLLLGRVLTEEFGEKNSRKLFYGSDDGDGDLPRSISHMKISGRIVLDMWRVLRHELSLTSYSFENVMYHLAHERHPLLCSKSLSHYWEHPSRKFRHIVVEHFVTRVLGVIKIFEQLDFVNRTSELSRLFGIQFYEVLSRGSQFRVESMMLRLAKPLNYVAASPSVAQRAAMRAPASLPLILEPESLFYADPVIVLDFQSLYPSIIIAYNYCFSTCLGRVDKLGNREPFEFGCTHLQISPEELKNLEKDLTISPAGVAFVKSNVRKGILPTMLEEILETRLMVKKAMKETKENKILQKILFARQLGLKLIANVTYGYTAANFSGRMPCIEVGDSVVSKGRETLHRAIQLVKNNPKWRARVVYGDTDSIFVLTPGRTREEAFRIGAEIAEEVTQDNPKPVKLKLEKVYQPCILQTKKRYVGYKFESPEQEQPVFEAKGIETVRRDGCPATGKILEKALRILFDTRDVSLVKKYTVRQFAKLLQGNVNVQDLIFAKEYRGRKGYRPGACVPALQLAKQWTQHDKRAEPRVKERVPYVIVNGPPGVPLIRLVRSPRDLITDPSLRINAVYYITKAIIPPMQRCFCLLGADVSSWFAHVPRKFHKTYRPAFSKGQKKVTISQYFATMECFFCSEVTNSPICQNCRSQPQAMTVRLSENLRQWERSHDGILQICQSCCKRPTEIECVSIDCPVFFRRHQAVRTLRQGPELRELLLQHLSSE